VKNAINLAVGILLGLLLAWLLGFFDHGPPTAPAAVAGPAASTPASLAAATAKPILVTVATPRANVVMPTVAPVAAHGPDATPAKATSPAPAVSSIQQQGRVKAMTNNLRILSSAAQQYMLEKRVTTASYYDLVGTGTDNYIRSINPVMGEDYTGIMVNQTDTQVNIVAPDGTYVEFNL